MQRRRFLRDAGAASAAALLAACGGDKSQGSGGGGKARKRVRWRLASSFPRGLDTIYGAAETLSKLVEAMSGGDFTIRAYPAGEIVPGLQVLDAVQQGTVQCGHTTSYYYTGKHPALAFDTTVPFGLTVRQQLAWLDEGGGNELLAPLFEKFGIVRFPGGGTGAQMGGWFRRQINSVEDLKGLKMRIPGMGGEVMSRLGVTVQVLAGGDIYPALERGAIDATEWVGPYDDEKLGFHKVAEYYYYPGWWEPGPTLSFYVGTKAWKELPDDFKVIFETAARAAGMQMIERYDARNPEALGRLRKHGTKLAAFPDDVMAASRDASNALMQEYASKNPEFKAIYEPWDAFRQSISDWFSTAEQSYQAFAYRKG